MSFDSVMLRNSKIQKPRKERSCSDFTAQRKDCTWTQKMLGTYVCAYSMLQPNAADATNCIVVRGHVCTSIHGKGKVKSTTQRPTNLKRGRSERVSWGEAEEKSTVTVTLLQRREKRQQL